MNELKRTFIHDFWELSEHCTKRRPLYRIVGQTHADKSGQFLGGRLGETTLYLVKALLLFGGKSYSVSQKERVGRCGCWKIK